MDSIKIVEVVKTSKNVLESMQKLLPQLSTNYKSFKQNDLEEILDSDNTRLFIACDSASENEIVGTFTLVIFRIPTGKILRIEDVIVDEKKRGRGIGKLMINHAMDFARDEGVIKIELTSHPSRLEANKLYQSFGFTQIDTNVYRLKF